MCVELVYFEGNIHILANKLSSVERLNETPFTNRNTCTSVSSVIQINDTVIPTYGQPK